MNGQYNHRHINRSALFDWLVFAICISLGLIFPSLRDFIISPVFSTCMFAALLFYSVGAWLKHLPLSCRIIQSGKPYTQLSLLLILLIGHWLIIITTIFLSEPAARQIFRFPPRNEQGEASGILIQVSIFLAIYITWLVFQSKNKIKNSPKYSAVYLFRREMVADIFLIIGVSLLSFAFWEKGFIAVIASNEAEDISDVGFKFIFLSIGYILFYLPLRYLFLIEDHSSWQTWKRLLIIFGLLLTRSLFEIIKF